MAVLGPRAGRPGGAVEILRPSAAAQQDELLHSLHSIESGSKNRSNVGE
jgi:hypothetical protein